MKIAIPTTVLTLWVLCAVSVVAQVPTVRSPRMQSTPAAEARRIEIYKADGTRQCQDGVGVSLSSMASELTTFGVAVTSQEKRQLPISIPTQCDLPTGAVNLYNITLADLLKVNIWRDTTTAFKVWDFELVTMTIWKDDGLRECGNTQAISIDSITHLLTNAGVLPIKRRTMAPGLGDRRCGEANGARYLVLIPEEDYPAAFALGFREPSNAVQGRIADCATVPPLLPGSSEALRLKPPEATQMIIPNWGSIPRSSQGTSLEVSFYVSAHGKVDSLRTSVPVQPDITKALALYSFKPSTYKGCPVAGVLVMTFTLGR